MKETNYTIAWQTPYDHVDGKTLFEHHFIEVESFAAAEVAGYCLRFPDMFCMYISEYKEGAKDKPVICHPHITPGEFVEESRFEEPVEGCEYPSGPYQVTARWGEGEDNSFTLGFDTFEEMDVAHRILKTRDCHTMSLSY